MSLGLRRLCDSQGGIYLGLGWAASFWNRRNQAVNWTKSELMAASGK